MNNLRLLAIIPEGVQTRILHVSLSREAQEHLTDVWGTQYTDFIAEKELVEFDAGYKLGPNEIFVATDFVLPEWLQYAPSDIPDSFPELSPKFNQLANVKGLVGSVTMQQDGEVLLFQGVTPARRLQPGQILFLRKDTYDISETPGLALDRRLSAVYERTTMTLYFRTYRTVNAFLPLVDYYREASEDDILSVLSHERLEVSNPADIAERSNQWFNRRFAMLRDSDILDQYSAEDIASRGQAYGVDVIIKGERIVFPADASQAKRLLQLLNEERFRGPITGTLFETNSKRPAT